MKTDLTTNADTSTISSTAPADSAKLVSLLALATSAIAIPQTSNADIIFTDLSSNPQGVGYTSANAQFLLTLPGSVQFGFARREFSTYTTFPITTTLHFRSVIAGDLGDINDASARIQVAGGLAAHLPFGVAWDQGNPLALGTTVGWASTYARVPSGGYDHEFFAWQFVDDSPSGGGAIRYGWAEVSLTVGFYPVGPNLTVWGYAYDNTGAKPTMGQVPEPSSAALLVFGAMALGARGLRNWRQNRESISNS